MSNDKFPGFTPSEQNWSKLPHQLINALPLIETLGEMKVIIYTLRHTWGYQDKYKKITLDEFEKGRKRKDGARIDNGTGLTKPTIVNGIKRAVAHGFLFEHTDTSDTARVKKFYSLTREGLKDLTPDVKRFNTWGKDSLHRTEKETIEKETFDIKPENSKLEKPNPVTPIVEAVVENEVGEKQGLNALAAQLATICQIDIDTAVPKTREALKQLTVSLYGKSDIIKHLANFLPWWHTHDWRGKQGQVPTPGQIGDTWGQFAATTSTRPGSTNGSGPILTSEQRARLAELTAQDAQQK